MPKREDIKKVLVIGSGPIIIGQAAEFDYAGTQACRVLKEENIEVVLVNSNPATIMTDNHIADSVYLEALVPEVIRNIIRKEQPDSILPTLGGQTGLNLAMELAESGFLEEAGVRLLGTSVDTIKKAEDREVFKETMEAIGEPVIDSVIANELSTALDFVSKVGYPVIIRPAYTLGGTGGGFAGNEEQLIRIVREGLQASRVHQVLIERSVAGWKEIEFEVIRDAKGTCITVCNMENIDPVGIHTGDSIVVAPSQTLRPEELDMLRDASINIINALKIEGGCNVQYALDPESMQYYVIEVNPRVSRSSALASKATGYPIARVATKIAIGYSLDEIGNGKSSANNAGCEPVLDYVVVKIPRWPFDKFVHAEKTLGTKMKATGEVMAIGSNFDSALLKAMRSLELGRYSLESPSLISISTHEIENLLSVKNHERIFVVSEALRRGIAPEKVHQITQIDLWFLRRILHIITMEAKIIGLGIEGMNSELMLQAKRMGFSDWAIAGWLGLSELQVRNLRKEWGIKPGFKAVEIRAVHSDAGKSYYYSSYEGCSEASIPSKKTVAVLGSGPIRIGQGIEFDYCSVHSIWALKKAGYQTVTINNNPETVSTDFDTSDRLYFEPLSAEDVWNVLEQETPMGVVVQFGGQTAIKLTETVASMGYAILGTQAESIDMAEDREKFEQLLAALEMNRPAGTTVYHEEEAVEAAVRLGFPVLVRPSYVLGGQGMEIAYNEENIREYMSIINRIEQQHPILIDKYLLGKEIELDAICDGEDVLIPGIMEHIERAGVHSGDSISVYPPQTISSSVKEKLVDYTKILALALKVKGLLNIQFVLYHEELYIIEVNPRSSRTIPYISKVTGIPMVELATRAMLGEKLKNMGYGTGLLPDRNIVAVKVPVFSFEKLPNVEVSLGPEMKSTGEVLGISKDYSEALYKGLLASGMKMPDRGGILMTVSNMDKQELIPIASHFEKLGYRLYATSGTAHVLNFNYIGANVVQKLGEGRPNIEDLLAEGEIQLIINTPTKGRMSNRDGFKIRRKAVEQSIPCLTSLDTARVLVYSLKTGKSAENIHAMNLKEIG